MSTSGPHRALAFLALTLPHTVAAQDTPRFELFGGYSYLRLSKDSGFESTGLNGWNVSGGEVQVSSRWRVAILSRLGRRSAVLVT
jgi:hypothetical protein